VPGDGPRERLLESATTLIREHGVAGTGLTELLKESRTARGSIYQHFPDGKDELVGASVRAAGAESRAAIAALRELGEPAAVVRAVVAASRAALLDEDFVRGCPVVAAAVSGPTYPTSVRAAAEVFRGWVDELAQVLADVGVPERHAVALASTVISASEGALVQARAARSAEPLDLVAEQLVNLVAAHVAEGEPVA